MKDFFISYNRHDKQWAEWIAWTLEEAGYTVVIQAWDFRPGGNFVLDMQRAAAECEKTIAVLSANYLQSEYTQSEWGAAFAGDPQSLKRTLIPMRVGECRPEGVLKTIVYVDLVSVTADEAKALVLGALRERAKPAQEPSFPGQGQRVLRRMEPERVEFPGATSRMLPRVPTPPVQTRRQFLWLALAGGGVGGALLIKYLQLTGSSNLVPETPTPTPTSSSRLDFSPVEPTPTTPSTVQSTALQSFAFKVVSVNAQGKETKRQQSKAQYFTEYLGSGNKLEMVSIPGGTFQMGSPASEKERIEREGPQHAVTVKPFFMGKCVVTQAQWKAVAALPQMKQKLSPDPSQFKGANRPVERVSWYEAVEFCDRLSRQTGREYRLPSEAEWEYACRAGTTTPFHFGETLTTDLANYDGNDTYNGGPKGKNRGQTTDVGSFPANAFGLYDMHGNVWEWCLDHWHDNYQGAPTDGSAWVTGGDDKYRQWRGGSWRYDPWTCRSALRFAFLPDSRYFDLGFRVVCSVPGTP